MNSSSVVDRDDIVSSLIHSSMLSACSCSSCLAADELDDQGVALFVSYHGTCPCRHNIAFSPVCAGIILHSHLSVPA